MTISRSRAEVRKCIVFVALSLFAPIAADASAEESATANVAQAAVPAQAPPAPPLPYSLPWQLRPAVVGNVIRLDTSQAFYETAGSDGSTTTSSLLATYKVLPQLAPLVRVGMVRNDEPGAAVGSGTAFVNPILGLMYAVRLPADLRLSAFIGGTLPIGMGGDKARSKDATAAAVFRGIAARSAMDNAMFAVNYATAIGGVDLALVTHKLTVQVEATLFQLTRVKNEAVDTDSSRTNFTSGLHVGYFAIPWLSLGGELRYQRWLSTPAAVKANPAARETVTVAMGPRFHIKVGEGRFIRPGISYAFALDKPLSDGKYNIVQLDIPMAF